MPKKNKRSTSVDDITAHFASTYISSNGRLAAFRQLCADLDVAIGTSITQCKKNIKTAHVNIRDFVRVQQAGGDVSTIKYPTFAALRRDMHVNPSRKFPIRKAKGDELLAAMLITV